MAKKTNPWAICHSQLGKKKTDKFERCVMDIKRKEGTKEWTDFQYKIISLMEAKKKKDKDWIQGAVDPEHEGDCTPMTKSTCTPKRKALAKTFKKMGRKRDKEIVSKKEKKAKGQ